MSVLRNPAPHDLMKRDLTAHGSAAGGLSAHSAWAALALRNVLAAGLACLIVSTPVIAEACSVCVDPEAENRTAFIVTTIFLSILPLVLVGGMIAWLWRRSLQIEAGAGPRTLPQASIRP